MEKNMSDEEKDLEKANELYREGKHAESFELLLKLSKAGYAPAQRTIAFHYRKGWGCEESLEETAYWFRKAAEQGDGEAQYCMGIALSMGYGIDQNFNEAFSWFQKAADQGEENAKKFLEDLKSQGKSRHSPAISGKAKYQSPKSKGKGTDGVLSDDEIASLIAGVEKK
jgi:TPR repeat protein